MASGINPLFPGLEGLSDLGLGASRPVGPGLSDGTLTRSAVDSAIAAWRDKHRSLLDEAAKAAPVPQGGGGAVLSSLIASILAGATGAGVEASGPARQAALESGRGVIDERNAIAAQQHADQMKAVASQMKSMEDVSSGVRMLLQAQPKLFQGDMMRLASEIAFGGSGLRLTPEASMSPGVRTAVDALDFLIKSNDVHDPVELSRLHNMRMELVTGRKMDLVNGKAFMDPELGINSDWMLENVINARELLAEFQRTQVFPDVTRFDLKPSIKVSYQDSVLTALQRWAKFQVEGGMSKREALDALATEHPDDRVLLEEKFGPTRVGGEIDLEVAGDIALRTYLRQGETGQVLEGGLGKPEFYNEKLNDYLGKELEARQQKNLDQIIQAHDDESQRLQTTEGLSEEDADEAALKIIMGKPQYRSLVREMVPEFKQKLRESTGW